MEKLIGVIIGCGAIAREHLTALGDMPGAEIAGVCDLSPARAEACAERFGVAKWYTDYKAMLAEIRPDLVHITTPPSSHFDIARHSLEAGLNVLCEKPVTLDYAQFQELRQLAERNGCMLMENQNLRYHSSCARLAKLVSSGELGGLLDVQLCYSLNITGPKSGFTDANMPHFGLALKGGVIGDFLPHLAYLTTMFAGDVLSVRTIWDKYVAATPLPADEFRAIVKGSRASAYVSFSGNTQPDSVWLRLNGTKMQAEANLYEPPRLTMRRQRGGEAALAKLADGLIESRQVFGGTASAFSRKLGGTASYDGLPQLIESLYAAIAARAPQPVSLAEIDASVRLTDDFTKAEFKL